jgi:pimeloyl-ACP methyl ester carboxylesterase
MERTPLNVPVAGGEIVGWAEGEGPPVLLLHGGPTGYDYLEDLAAEILPGYLVAAYQRRGTTPSTVSGPFDMETEADDAAAVMDALGWDRAYVVGHSLGGYYALQLSVRIPDRVLGALIVDPLGAVGDGGMREFWHTQLSRMTPEVRARIAEIDLLEDGGTATDDDLIECERLIWPTFFADSEHTMPFAMRTNFATHAAIQAEVRRDRPMLAQSLPDCAIPMRFLHGTKSPMPISASTDTLALLPNAELDLATGAGHFVWFEVPGSVRMSLGRLVAQTQAGHFSA